jgi:chromosome segregation ATPase
MRTNLGQAEQTITTLKCDLEARSTALDSLRQSDAEKSRQVETLQSDIKTKTDAMADLDTRLKSARTEVESATQQNSELTNRVSSLRLEVSKMSETLGEQGAEITRLVEQTKQQAQQIQVAQKDAEQAHSRAAEAQQQVRAANEEIMSRAPVRIEERHSTQTGRKVAEKSGVPFGAAFDPIGDMFTGLGEGLFGKSGPVILVAVYRDGHEEVVSKADADLWASRGIRVQRLGTKSTARASATP